MSGETEAASAAAPLHRFEGTVYPILLAISCCHFLNDLIQSLLAALYPLLKQNFGLDFGQVGLITLAFQLTASLLQPVVGLYTDRRPLPYSLPFGMGLSLLGLLLLSVAPSYGMLVLAACLIGLGSSIFHPESSRVARMASGGQLGLAQSVFQVGGNGGSAAGPLLAAFIVMPRGQGSIAWFSAAALTGIAILSVVSTWYRQRIPPRRGRMAGAKSAPAGVGPPVVGLSRRRVVISLAILVALIFSKYFYMASLNTYFTFYLMQKFNLSIQAAQIHLFIFLGAVAIGTLLGGPIGDRFGRKYVIWFSILGVFPFTAMLPYANLFWTGILSVVIGLILASAFSAILVYATELVPGNVGAIAGLFFGFAFGMAGLGAAVLGELADHTSVELVYRVCAFLPLIGLLAIFLPPMGARHRRA